MNPVFVYVIARNGLDKIGFTRASPAARAKVLGGTLLAFKEHIDAVRLEKALHHHFREKRVGGEWFDLTVGDVHWIKHLNDEEVAELIAACSKSARMHVPAGLEARRATRGTKQLVVELSAVLVDAFRAFCHDRGETLRDHLEIAMQRHLDNPPGPLRPIVPPLPPFAALPQKPPKKPKRK